MKLPGTAFFHDQRAVRSFEEGDPRYRDIVFYSEGAADWPHLGPIVLTLVEEHDRAVSYLTSDPADPGLAVAHPNLRTFNIGAGTARTVLFARIDCRQFVMTLPDLGNLWLKRSVHPVQYVYAFHSMNSTHTSYRKGAFDHFDTVLCVGPHHVDEIRRTEETYGHRPKRLIEHGSTKLDAVLSEVSEAPAQPRVEGPPRVLVAPTWGESSLIERSVGREVIDTLVAAGLPTTLRLHPMTTRRLPKLVHDLRRMSDGSPLFALEVEMSATESWLRSDIMISDWSGAAIEYAFALRKPVIYVDTPPKIMNPEWELVGLRSFEDRVRSAIGTIVAPADVDGIPRLVTEVMRGGAPSAEPGGLERSSWVFNIGGSRFAAAAHLAGR